MLFDLFYKQTTININVTDINDHDPVFNTTIYNFTTPENDFDWATRGNSIGSVSATDEDLGRNGDIHYKIISTDMLTIFEISPQVHYSSGCCDIR